MRILTDVRCVNPLLLDGMAHAAADLLHSLYLGLTELPGGHQVQYGPSSG
jgi:hypothetical protein